MTGNIQSKEKLLEELDLIAKRLVKRDFELLQTNELLREMDAAKSHFVSIAAHQLRTPLTGVTWSIQMLLAGDFTPLKIEQKEVLENTLKTLKRFALLIDDLLSVAHVESGHMNYKFSLFSIQDLLQKIFADKKDEFLHHEIDAKLYFPDGKLPDVRGDREYLTLALQNLLENAMIYNHKGGKIEMGLMQEKNKKNFVRVWIKDNGLGIPLSQVSLLGQKFFRADNVVKAQIPGTGLGLYIVKKILEKHQSRLEVESLEGKGSTFSFSLPLVV